MNTENESAQALSPLMFVGEQEFADDPAFVNKRLFYWDGQWTTIPQSVGHHPNLVKAEAASKPQFARMGSRIILPVRIFLSDGRIICQPFYRSSGLATPDISPKGTWWPTCGLYTKAVCREKGIPDSYQGYIGKYFYAKGKWRRHLKNKDLIPKCWLETAKWLEESFPF